ncbi:unnamed protein product [Leptidea sinapis]|uniref:Transmembrane inner ear expressed protein n=1 Tax=Leptidea sinapis TaxID=189913 RepID=A0A5E4PQ90_9NEOP|nr:unnamed protein product [Leptidea sinapis]
MDPLMGAIENAEEPEWLEKLVFGEVRVWQIMFLCLAGITTLIVMVCCCFRFRIPRTKQQIEADYKRRKITNNSVHLVDVLFVFVALDLLHKQNHSMEENQGFQPSSMSPQQSSLETSIQQNVKITEPDPPGGLSFVKFATKVANLSKISPPKSPTSPTATGSKMDF